MTKDLSKLGKVYAAIEKISDVPKLNMIIRKAPLKEVKINAIHRLLAVNKNFQTDEAFCIDTLLSLNIDPGRLSITDAGKAGVQHHLL